MTTPRRSHFARALALVAALLLGPGMATAGAQLPAVATEAELDPRKGVNFHALVRPDTVYVGQQASYQVGVFLNEDVRARLRRNPEFVPPEMPGMLAYELPVAHGILPRVPREQLIEVHVFERAVFPLTPGRHEIPAARLSYSLPITRGFFSREESHSIRSRPVRVVALAPPAEGRPADFDGAVAASVSLRSRVDTTGLRVGDPMLLTVRVDGTGNVNLFPRPRIELAWGDAVAGEERVRLDSTARTVRGAKEFDWLVTPRLEGQVVLPAIRYPHFDPYGESYEVAFTAPDTLWVQAGTLAAVDTASAGAAALPLRQSYRGELPLPPSRSPLYWLAVASLPLPAMIVGLRRRRPRRPRTTTAAEALAALAALGARDGSGAGDAAAEAGSAGRVRALFMRAVATRLAHPRLALTRPGEVVRALRLEGVSRETAAGVEAFLGELDRAAYAGDGAARAAAGIAARASALYAAVDAEARRRPATPAGARGRPPASLALLVLLSAAAAATPIAAVAATSVVQARPSSSPAPVVTRSADDLFAEGVRAYQARRFDDAASLFDAATRRAPRAADAWANLGTSAWSAGDSAGAAVGWQRALRLEPTASDLRPRLALLPGAQLSGAAMVPPVSPRLLEWIALAAWIAAWLAAFAAGARWPGARRASAGAPVALAVGMAALLVWASAVLLDERLAARDLAVVAQAGSARAAAALNAPGSGSLHAGQLVRVHDRRGVWERVDDGGSVAGWVEAERLRGLRRVD